jgi:peptide deformylase|tara:strand:+ start:655 stop:1302 length:648 start_codon:yes stop_codon:yes gene_type:complete
MRELINCFEKNNPIINKKLKEVSVEVGMEIAAELLNILNERKDGIGLAANQVGIDAAVAVINVRKPIILINPTIISKETEIPYYEGCLSFPGKGCHTKRYETVEITTAQEEGTLIFSGVDVGEESRGTWEGEKQQSDREQRTLEAVCVQHEIDHLNGMRILDRQVSTTIRAGKKYGRNEIIGITDGETYKEIKYKKAKPLLDSGEWTIYVGGPIT